MTEPPVREDRTVATSNAQSSSGCVIAAVVALDGATARWVIDPSTGRVLRIARRAIGLSGPTEETQEFSDFRPVAGLQLPFAIKVLQNGRVEQEATLSACEVNPELDPALFAKP